MNRQQRRHQERQNQKQNSESTEGAIWTIWKTYPDGRQEALASKLEQHQARALREHYRVGCLEGEMITLRTDWVVDV